MCMVASWTAANARRGPRSDTVLYPRDSSRDEWARMSRFMQGSVRGRHYIREGIQFSTVIAELWAFKGTFSCLGVITLIYSEWEKGTHTRRVFGLIKPLIILNYFFRHVNFPSKPK